MRRVLVVEAVAGEEGYGYVVVGEDGDGGGWVAPWGRRVECCDGREAWEGLESCSAYYGDLDGIWGVLEGW